MGIASVLWGIASVLWRLLITVEDSFSTVGGSFSTVEVVQYRREKHQYMRGITSVHAGDNMSTLNGIWYCAGDTFSTVGG